MDSNMIMGAVLVALISLLGFLWKFRDEVRKEDTPIKELNESVIRLTDTMNHYNDNFINLKGRVDKHGEEIHSLQRENEGHEVRISTLERHCDDLLH